MAGRLPPGPRLRGISRPSAALGGASGGNQAELGRLRGGLRRPLAGGAALAHKRSRDQLPTKKNEASFCELGKNLKSSGGRLLSKSVCEQGISATFVTLGQVERCLLEPEPRHHTCFSESEAPLARATQVAFKRTATASRERFRCPLVSVRPRSRERQPGLSKGGVGTAIRDARPRARVTASYGGPRSKNCGKPLAEPTPDRRP